jgi:hypothetical protein
VICPPDGPYQWKEVEHGTDQGSFKYAEYDGDVYRWPTNHTYTGNIADITRWRYGAWEEVAYGTDIRAKVIHWGMKLTPEAVVAETGTKDALA